MNRLLINNIIIPDEDILDLDRSAKEELSEDFSITASTLTITLDNIKTKIYDPDVTTSIFYTDWYNKSVLIYDNSTGELVFRGKVKGREKQVLSGKNIIKVKVENILKDILSIPCATSYGTAVDKTPSECIQYILQTICNVPDSQIDLASFGTASQYQADNSGYIRIKSRSEDTGGTVIDCGSVINEIMKLTQSHVYAVNDVITYYQWRPYDATSDVGEEITEIISNTYKRTTNDKTIYNDYGIWYLSSATIAKANATQPSYALSSEALHGKRLFRHPSEVNESDEAKYVILCKTATSADFYGTLALQRHYAVKEVVDFSLIPEKAYLALNDQVDLSIEGYYREPLRIISRDVNAKNNKSSVDISAVFLDRPHLTGTTVRDATRPETVELLRVIQTGNATVSLAWTQSIDIVGYKVYFSTDGYEYISTYNPNGLSPITVTTPTILDGVCYYALSGLTLNTRYYFKVIAYDTYGNVSVFSNVKSCFVFYTPIAENQYRTTGNLCSGIYLDPTNANLGQPGVGYLHYNDYNYDAITYTYSAIYESIILTSLTGFNSILFSGFGPVGSLYIQWRSYNNGTFGSWQPNIYGIGNKTLNIDGSKQIQLRFRYYVPDWAQRTVYIYIKSIVEV